MRKKETNGKKVKVRDSEVGTEKKTKSACRGFVFWALIFTSMPMQYSNEIFQSEFLTIFVIHTHNRKVSRVHCYKPQLV